MNKVLAFMLGAGLGSLLTWKIIEKKYKQLAEDEINSVRQYYKSRLAVLADDIQPSNDKPADKVKMSRNDFIAKTTDEEVEKYTGLLKDSGYTNEEIENLLNDPDVSLEHNGDNYEIFLEPHRDKVQPYVIAPEEYGDREDFDTKSWTYYSDFVLVDEEGEIVVDPESIIGDALAHFGDYEDDSVYVRNEETECDYEILKHEKTFSEVYGS